MNWVVCNYLIITHITVVFVIIIFFHLLQFFLSQLPTSFQLFRIRSKNSVTESGDGINSMGVLFFHPSVTAVIPTGHFCFVELKPFNSLVLSIYSKIR